MGINVLTGLLDEKIIKIISLFMKDPNKKLYLSEIARLSNVNTATTFRILNKLVKERLVYATVIGKVRIYQLSRGERVDSLTKLLKKEEDNDALDEFCDKVEILNGIRIVLLDSKTNNNAKVIVVGEYAYRERIERICNDIFNQKKFQIKFVELTCRQYDGLKGLNTFNLDKKILFKRN
ncbi:winged helix-turn-helix transcriptional regulator [Candidatus Pacearchaeota archaeon]|nr:winged helix-turn-helix transcriptional regulator [Candidatus Pacearchaeota archaeon]